MIDTAASNRKGFYYITTFFSQLMDSFTFSSDKVRLCLITNSGNPRVKFSLGQYNNPNKMKHVLRVLQPIGKVRRTGAALALALRQLFSVSKRKKTVILLTAGKSSDAVLQPVQNLVSRGVDIFSIGVKPGAVLSEVLTTAKDPQHAYNTGYSGLGALVQRIAKKACTGNEKLFFFRH